MAAELSRSDIDGRRVRQRGVASLDEAVRREIEKVRVAGREYKFVPETRCRVCQEESSRTLVNRLLSAGLTYQAIVNALEPLNAVRPKNNKINYSSVWQHARRHFPIEEAARAVYREILEKRAAEQDQDFIAGTGSIVNVFSYLEAMANKGWETMSDPQTTVSAQEGMAAVVKLHELTRKDVGFQEQAEAQRQMGRIIQTVLEVVPEELRPEIMRRLRDEKRPEQVLDVEEVDEDVEDDLDDEYDPDDEDDYGDGI